MTVDHPPTRYYPALDGLRGLAILLVVVYHNFGFIDYFFFGWIGVDLFFVLSGFLITSILMRMSPTGSSLRNFYIRRVLRIFPLYYLALIVFLVILPQFGATRPFVEYYTEHQWWLWTYLQNWLFIFKPAGNAGMLHHFWSLAVEEQYYIAWPLIVFLVRKPKALIYLLLVVLAAIIALRTIIWVKQIEHIAYFNLYTFSRIDGLCIGSALALLRQVNPSFFRQYTTAVVFILAVLNFIFYFINRYYGFSFPFLAIAGYTTFAVMLALLVQEAVSGHYRPTQLLFTNRALVFFGKISYCLYIVHWPIYVLLSPVIQKWCTEILSLHDPRLAASLIATLLGILVSMLSYRYFEHYLLQLKKRYT